MRLGAIGEKRPPKGFGSIETEASQPPVVQTTVSRKRLR